jgi:hypothetical protein
MKFKFAQSNNFWIIDGQPVYVGLHVDTVLEYLLKKNNIFNISSFLTNDWARASSLLSSDFISEDKKQYLREKLESIKKLNIPNEELNVIANPGLAYDYAINEMGWIRVSGLSIEMHDLSTNNLQELTDALLQTYRDRVYNMKFSLYTESPSAYFPNVKFEDIKNADIRAIKNSQYTVNARSNMKFKIITSQYNFNNTNSYQSWWITNEGLKNATDIPGKHAGYIKKYILDKNNIQYDAKLLTALEKKDALTITKYIKPQNIPLKDLQMLFSDDDDFLRDYGVSELGWIRISGNSVYMSDLNEENLRKTAQALLKIYGNGAANKKFTLLTPHDNFSNVSFVDIESGSSRNIKINDSISTRNNYASKKYSQILLKTAINHEKHGRYAKADIIDGAMIRLANLGEFWLQNGQAIFADGDIGDMNHEGIVIDTILGSYDLDYDTFPQLEQKSMDEYGDRNTLLKELGMTDEELNAVRDLTDAREYGLKNLGWQRLT